MDFTHFSATPVWYQCFIEGAGRVLVEFSLPALPCLVFLQIIIMRKKPTSITCSYTLTHTICVCVIYASEGTFVCARVCIRVYVHSGKPGATWVNGKSWVCAWREREGKREYMCVCLCVCMYVRDYWRVGVCACVCVCICRWVCYRGQWRTVLHIYCRAMADGKTGVAIFIGRMVAA